MSDQATETSTETQTSAGEATDATSVDAAGASTEAGGAEASGGSEQIWRDDWRQQMAGDDEKALKHIDRYGSPSDVYTALRAAQQKISSGEVKSALPDNATPEQVASWRAENGIPDEPAGYRDALPEGVVIGEDDQERMDLFMQSMHEKNMPPAAVSAAVEWYYNELANGQDTLAQMDSDAQVRTEDKLRAEWGQDYTPNMNHMKNWLAGGPEGLSDLMMEARGPDGVLLKNNPDFMRWASQTAREANPMNMILPASG
ncbi:MAG: hypothetical protein ACPG61_13945, partial [Paracoccaceae bacterium]